MGDAAVSLRKLPVGILGYSKLKVPSPGQIFILEGGGVFLATQNSKTEVLDKFSFWEGEVFFATQNSKSQLLARFSWGRGGYSWPAQNWYYWQNEPKILEAELACIADSVCERLS